MNPVDAIHQVITKKMKLRQNFEDAIDLFREQSLGEFFDSPEQLREHYFRPEIWDKALGKGLMRVGFMFNSKFIKDGSLFESTLEAFSNAMPTGAENDLKSLTQLLLKARIGPDYYCNGGPIEDFTVTVPGKVADCLDIMGNINSINSEIPQQIILRKPLESQVMIRERLNQNSFHENADQAIARTISSIPGAFNYELSFANEAPELRMKVLRRI